MKLKNMQTRLTSKEQKDWHDSIRKSREIKALNKDSNKTQNKRCFIKIEISKV